MTSRAVLLILGIPLSPAEVVLALQANSAGREWPEKAEEGLTSTKVRLCGTMLKMQTSPTAEFLKRKI